MRREDATSFDDVVEINERSRARGEREKERDVNVCELVLLSFSMDVRACFDERKEEEKE